VFDVSAIALTYVYEVLRHVIKYNHMI